MNEYERALDRLQRMDNAEVLVAAITQEAYAYWGRADFCLQYASLEDGSVNRVAWSMVYGFRLLPEFCTQRFIEANSNKEGVAQ